MKNDLVKILVQRFCKHYETNKFYSLATKGSCSLTFFLLRRHVTSHISINPDHIRISGICESYSVYDSKTLFLGYLFETPKKNTTVTPLMLSVKIPPVQEEYEEIQLPPKYGILAYRSANSSTLIIAQEELDLQYSIRDSQM